MFQMWVKLNRKGHAVRQMTIEDDREVNRTKKVFDALAKACKEMDLSQPIWLEKNVKEFQQRHKTRFTADNFVEALEYDNLEIQILEEDDFY